MKKFFVLRERSKVSEIRAGFLQEGVFVKKGLELSLLTYVFDTFSTQPRELFSKFIFNPSSFKFLLSKLNMF